MPSSPAAGWLAELPAAMLRAKTPATAADGGMTRIVLVVRPGMTSHGANNALKRERWFVFESMTAFEEAIREAAVAVFAPSRKATLWYEEALDAISAWI